MKRLLVIFCVVAIITVNFVSIYAITSDPKIEKPSGGTVSNDFEKKTRNIWATVTVLVQIISVATVVFAGLRYMFASADQKADIKKGLIYLTIGAVLVFSATTIIKAVGSAATKVLTP